MKRLLTAVALVLLWPPIALLRVWDTIVLPDPTDDIWEEYERG